LVSVFAGEIVPPSSGGVDHIELNIFLIEQETVEVIHDRVKILCIARQEVQVTVDQGLLRRGA
jgi:hypothetical protein